MVKHASYIRRLVIQLALLARTTGTAGYSEPDAGSSFMRDAFQIFDLLLARAKFTFRILP